MPRLTMVIAVAGAAAFSLGASLVLGGFIFGAVNAQDCPAGLAGILGRIFIGILFAFLTPMFFGFPPRNEAGVGEPFNAWPYIVPVFVVVFATSLALLYLVTSISRPDGMSPGKSR